MPDLKDLWLIAGNYKDGKVTTVELSAALDQINLNFSKGEVRKLIEKFASESNFFVNESKFHLACQQIIGNNQFQYLFNALKSGSDDYISEEKFCQDFLKQVQHHSDDEIMKLRPLYVNDGKVSFEMFLNYLDSDDASINRFSQTTHDRSRPMNHYFINSSHNTYLTGDQLGSESPVQAYINVLKNGCRCVELDCWEGQDGEPVIYHGFTLTSKILFKDVIHAVKEYAFYASPYPLILSLENHCGIEQQKVMARHLREILGPLLGFSSHVLYWKMKINFQVLDN